MRKHEIVLKSATPPATELRLQSFIPDEPAAAEGRGLRSVPSQINALIPGSPPVELGTHVRQTIYYPFGASRAGGMFAMMLRSQEGQSGNCQSVCWPSLKAAARG